MPGQSDAIHPVQDRWRVVFVCYLAWALLFFAVEGAGRQACRVPSRRWVDAGDTVSERNLRAWTRDRSIDCLDANAWYSSAMGALFACGLVAPFVIVWLIRKRILRAAMSLPAFRMTGAALLYIAAFIVALLMAMAPYAAAEWLYDAFG